MGALPAGLTVEIVVRADNKVLAVIPLASVPCALLNRIMEPALAQGDGAVAGCIRPADPLLTEARDRWLADMRRRGCAESSVKHFGRYLELCAAHAGWTTSGSVTLAGAIGFLAAMREGDKPRWSGATHDQACSALRRFGTFLKVAGYCHVNPLEGLENSGETTGIGSRALLTDEARALVRAARDWERRDRKVKAPLLVWFVFLFLTALRPGEAARIRWRDIDLEAGTLWSDPAWAKNARRMAVPLNDEILGLLREYRKSTDAGPDDVLFPVRPNHHTWARLLGFAGIKAEDARRRTATPYSARKWCASELDRLNAPSGIVSLVLRHFASIADRHYVDRLEAEARGFLNKMPRLLPDETYAVQNPVENGDTGENPGQGLTPAGEIAEDVETRGRTPHGPDSQAVPCPLHGSNLRLVAEVLEMHARIVGLAASALRKSASDHDAPHPE